jgi:hypothetical protein
MIFFFSFSLSHSFIQNNIKKEKKKNRVNDIKKY